MKVSSVLWKTIKSFDWTYRNCYRNGVAVNLPLKYYHIPFSPGTNYRPAALKDIPSYEDTLCKSLSKTVEEGDHVVVVGGGLGVTSIHAARLVSPYGQVTSFEASLERFKDLKWAVKANDQQEIVTPVHALVGKEVKVYGEKSSVKKISPADLPQCDALELDCEGAELMILDKMSVSPSTIIVETHGFRGASTLQVRSKLEGLGYKVENMGIAEPRIQSSCKEKDIRVLIGKKNR